MCRAAPFRQRRSFHEHRAGVTAGHREIGCVWTRIHPAALTEGPPVTRRAVRVPAVHRDYLEIDVERLRSHEPLPEFAEGQTVTHRQRGGTDEALASSTQSQPLDRAADGIRTIENPH